MRLGTQELLIVLLVVVILFGPTQIPKLTRMFGKSIKSFKDGMASEDEASSKDKEDKESKASDGKE